MFYSPLLPVHITGGVLGILSGTVAMIYRKGSPRHALAGKVFVASMLVMAATAVYLAVLRHQPNNIGGGILTFYLILTAWLTISRRDGETSGYDWLTMLIPVALGALTWLNGLTVLRRGASSENGVPVGMSFFMGTVMLLAAAGDLRMLLRGGVFGGTRIKRHLWRMCFLPGAAAGVSPRPAGLRGSPGSRNPAARLVDLLDFSGALRQGLPDVGSAPGGGHGLASGGPQSRTGTEAEKRARGKMAIQTAQTIDTA